MAKARALTLWIAALLLACAGARIRAEAPEPDPARVERLGRETVRIHWPQSFASGRVHVYAGLAPDRISHARPLAVGDGGSVTLTTAVSPQVGDDYRLYYELVPESGAAPLRVAERRLPLEGADNFRDLGGYRTRDGRRVRWGRLYRSNQLSDLTPHDLAYLRAIDVKLVCDFRSDREQRDQPDPALAPPPAQRLSLPVAELGVDPETMKQLIRTGGITTLAVGEVMLEAYRSFVTDHPETWAAMLRRLADPRSLPTVVHCTAGKDRTGFAAAVVLLALGVPEQEVLDDYLLTNLYREDFTSFVLRWVPLYSLFRTRPEDLVPLLEARSEYLQASLDTMVELYGSVDGFLETGLGLTPERRAALQRNLLASEARSEQGRASGRAASRQASEVHQVVSRMAPQPSEVPSD